MSLLARFEALLLVALIVAGCATGPLVRTPSVDGELRGMLYDLDRQPLADATVVLTRGEKSVSVVTDLHGRFRMGPVPFGPVTLRILKEGYEPLNWEFRFTEGSQVLYLQMPSSDQLFERAALALEKRECAAFKEYIDRAAALAPGSVQGVVLEATALELRGRAQEALQLLELFATERPVLAIELLRGDLYASTGDRAQAVVHWKNALAIKEDPLVRAKIDRE